MNAPSYEQPPIKVLHVITRMVQGGAQQVVLDLASHTDKTRYISILATGPSDGPEGSLVPRARSAGLDIRELPALVREISPVNDARAVAALVRLFRQERPMIVHTHTSKAGALGRVASKIARVPVTIHTPHGHVFYGYYGKLKTSLFVLIERWTARYADKIVMITENELLDHLELRIAGRKRFVVIHSGVDFAPLLGQSTPSGGLRDQLNISRDSNVVGTLGRLVPIKGQVHLIDAMPMILERVPDAHLVLVGSGELEASLQSRAAELKLCDRIHFAGYRSDVAACLKDMNLFALPSLNEGMGRVLVEAMAMRIPVVASDVCGIKDLVTDGINGRLVPPADPGALAASISDILQRPDLARAMGDAGYEKVVPAYGLDSMVTQTEALYDSELARVNAALRPVA